MYTYKQTVVRNVLYMLDTFAALHMKLIASNY